MSPEQAQPAEAIFFWLGPPLACRQRGTWVARGFALDIVHRNNVEVLGSGSRAMVFAHGFGCDQNMWRFVWTAFADDVGCGGSELSA